MDQNHCRIPYYGNQHKFSSPLDQGITGVKEHGFGLTLYRTIGTVKNKSSDFTIYCILSQLESWFIRNRCYPEELFIQIDGGAENANKNLLSMLELIVIRKMVRVIHSTRLPTGHTHEDIDACFALIWSCSRDKPCLTLKEYKDNIINNFANSKIPTTMKDVYVIPAYGALIEKCTDSRLAHLHKGFTHNIAGVLRPYYHHQNFLKDVKQHTKRIRLIKWSSLSANLSRSATVQLDNTQD
jgi:hypothetical protein